MSFAEIYTGVLARVSIRRRAVWVFVYAILFMVVFTPIATLSYTRMTPPSDPFDHPNNTCTSASCHGNTNSKAAIYIALNGQDMTDNPSITLHPGDSFELDFHFTNMLYDAKKYSGVGFEITGPTAPVWRISGGTVNHPAAWSENSIGKNYWNSAWDRAAATEKGVPARWTSILEKPGTYYLDFTLTRWSVPNFNAAQNDKGDASAGDLDAVANHAGADALISIPLETKPGTYRLTISGVGHDDKNEKSFIAKTINVEIKEAAKSDSVSRPSIAPGVTNEAAPKKGYNVANHGGKSACGMCHLSFVSVPSTHAGRGNDSCAGCHVAITPSVVSSPGPPKITHSTEGREQCIVCHGPGGLKAVGASHNGRTESLCQNCHTSAIDNTGVAPKIPHKLDGKDNCRACHATGFIAPMPGDHNGRSKETCAGCHGIVPKGGTPVIPHVVDGREQCSLCHGPGKLKPIGISHAGRDDVTCRNCHNRNTGGNGPALPKIPHSTPGKEQCLECHGAAGIIPVPGSHQGRTNESCANCHRSATDRNGATPKIPHILEGRNDCLECHQTGFLKPYSERHEGRANDICIGCHDRGDTASSATGAAAISHRIDDRGNCLVCHGAGGMVPAPATHAGRAEASCTTCHKASAAVKGGIPAIPHNRSGREQCQGCHKPGLVEPLPVSHKGKANETCSNCHTQSAAAAEGAVPLPRIPHDTNVRKECVVCHATGFATQLPGNHAGRGNETCKQCHQLGDLSAGQSVPSAPHVIVGAENCLLCHGGAGSAPAIAPAKQTIKSSNTAPTPTSSPKPQTVKPVVLTPSPTQVKAVPTQAAPLATQRPAVTSPAGNPSVTPVAAATTPTPALTHTAGAPAATTAATITPTEDPVWPPVKPRFVGRLVSTETGNYIVFTGWVENRTELSYSLIDVKIGLTTDMKYVDSYAGVPTQNKAGFDGATVGWVHHGLDSGKKEGPFVFVVKVTGNTAPGSEYGARLHVTWFGESGGSYSTEDTRVTIPTSTVQPQTANPGGGVPTAIDMLKENAGRLQDTYYTRELLNGSNNATAKSESQSQSAPQGALTITGGVTSNSHPATNTKIVSRDSSGRVISQHQGSYFRFAEVPSRGTVEFDSISESGVAARFEVKNSWQNAVVSFSTLAYNPVVPAPPGKTLRYFEVQSNQSNSGKVAITVAVTPQELTNANMDMLQLYSYNNGKWEKVPTSIDRKKGYLVGTVTSLGPLAMTGGSSSTSGAQVAASTDVGVLSSNGERGPHGNFEAMTDKCAACHRAHTASGNYLLVGGPTTYDFCMLCHGSEGAGANTDVKGGVYRGSGVSPAGTQGQRLNGGGFEFIGGTTTTSRHATQGEGGALGTAWGGGAGNNLIAKLECTSCHDPHGSTSYRLLRNKDLSSYSSPVPPGWTTGAVAWSQVTVGYSHSDVSRGGSGDSSTRGYTWVADRIPVAATNPMDHKIQASYDQGMTDFCAACHTSYKQYSGGAGNPWTTLPITMGDTTPSIRYAHTSYRTYTGNPNLPLAFGLSTNVSDNSGTNITCLTCHFAHGTTVQMSGNANGATNPSGQAVGATGGSANLFYDNRGVCNSCHQQNQ